MPSSTIKFNLKNLSYVSLPFRDWAKCLAPTCFASKAAMIVDQEYGGEVSHSHLWKTAEKQRARIPFCSLSIAFR